MNLFNEDYLLWEALALSVLLHFLIFHAGAWSYHFEQKHTVEIDITNMGHLGLPATAAPRPTLPPAPSKPMVKPKEWVQPRPDQKVAPAPIPTKPVAPMPEETPPPPPVSTGGPVNGEYGIGTGDANATVLTRIPQLLNLSDLSAILRRFFPEDARTEGRQATVVLDLHIDTEGHVQSADIVQSGGADFDAAAKRAVSLLRFTPAFLGSQRVAVKMRQAIQFKLES